MDKPPIFQFFKDNSILQRLKNKVVDLDPVSSIYFT